LVQHFDSTGRLRVQVGNIPGLGGNHGTILWAGSGALGARGIVDHVDDPSFPAVEVAHNYRTHLVAPTVATYATAGAVWTVGDAPLTQLVARTGGFGVAFACPSHGASLLLYSNGLSAMNGAATAFAPIAASAFNVSSSVEVKEDLIDVNDDVLDKLEAADIKWWRYTQDKVPPPAPEPELRPVYRDDGTMTLVEEQVVLDHRPVSDDPPWHLGPMWEDLPEGINQDNPAHGKQVDVRDLAGWALAVGQKLIAQNRGQAEEMKTLRAELDELKATVAALAKA
jgi:hypothetical protein